MTKFLLDSSQKNLQTIIKIDPNKNKKSEMEENYPKTTENQ